MNSCYTWVRVTSSQVLSRSPSFLGCLLVTPKYAAVGHVDIYDGVNTNSPRILTVRTGAGISNTVKFQPELETQRGLYIDIVENIDSILVQYAVKEE